MPRLLLVKLGAIGDVVMAIPAAHAMHAAGYEVDWICGRAIAPVLALYDWINVIEVDEGDLLLGSKTAGLRAVLALWRTLRRRATSQPYDLCATLYYDTRYKLLTLPVRARHRIALSHTDRATRLLPGRHHTDEYARILLAHVPGERGGRGERGGHAGRIDGELATQYAPIPVPAERLPRTLPSPHPTQPRAVLIPAGSRNLLRDDALRRWPIECYVELARHLLARGCEVLVAGGPGDEWASVHFAGLATTDLIAKLSLVESLALLDSAAVTVTHDTGPLHLAGLTSTAIVAIFGPTDPRGRLPQRANCVALWGGEGFACRPCYDGRDFAPCAHNGCMHQVTPAMVLAEIDALLTAGREGRELPPRVLVPEHTPLITAASLAPAAWQVPGASLVSGASQGNKLSS
jgi:heptosyltransferase-2